MSDRDDGFTLVELLIVIVILGILAAVTVFAVRGLTVEAKETVCDTEERVLENAVTAYFLKNDTTTILPTPPLDGEEYERTLSVAQFIRDPATTWNLAADGSLTPVGTPC